MFTLKNLHEATPQQIFDQSAKHLLTQNLKSVTSIGSCRYRHGILKCAAGCFIADDEYKDIKEGRCWGNIVKELVDIYPKATTHSELIGKLQRVHDGTNPELWKEELEDLARENILEFNF